MSKNRLEELIDKADKKVKISEVVDEAFERQLSDIEKEKNPI